HQSQGFKAFGLLQEETIKIWQRTTPIKVWVNAIDNDRIFEKPVVLLCPMLFFIDGEDLPGTMGESPCRGHIGEQDEAARLFLQTPEALGVRSHGRLQPIA